MEFLQNLLNNTQAPFLYALLLGLLTAISPCQLATNITAIAYISKDIENKKRIFANGLFYALGNAVGYSSIGLILFFGASKFHVSKILISNGKIFIGIWLIIIGILMLDLIKIKLPTVLRLSEKIQERHDKGKKLNAALLGFLFSITFCPYNAVLFFGMLIPLTITSVFGLFLPLVYSVSSGFPVIIIAYILAFSISGIGNFYNKMRSFQKWFNRIVSILFIAVGLYFLIIKLI
ncbi:MAG TPA: aromatic aminobenezylarsenical efflux permease ArsG family transporter [Bacteroidales bacterium]|nr:aromatic aminobenezylarsenical efflux permease ArsG family transporter [Bacteroidales bacterium]